MARNPWNMWALGLHYANMSAELMDASRAVIEHRGGLMRDASRDPFNADYAELWLMGAEKVAAFSAAGASALGDWAKLQQAWAAGSSSYGEMATRSWLKAMKPIHATATANARRLKAKRKR